MARLGFAERLQSYHAGIRRIARVGDVAGFSVHIAINSHSRLAHSTLRPGPIGAVRHSPVHGVGGEAKRSVPHLRARGRSGEKGGKDNQELALSHSITSSVWQDRAPWRS